MEAMTATEIVYAYLDKAYEETCQMYPMTREKVSMELHRRANRWVVLSNWRKGRMAVINGSLTWLPHTEWKA